MAKHHKKSHRRRVSRKHRRSSRKQQRGGSCAAYPHNRDVFAQNAGFAQRGGMAPFTAGDNYLLDAATRVQAEVAPLDKAFAELPGVIPRQMGGRRRRSTRRKSSHRRRRHTMRRRSHRRKTHRRQRGGMAPFGYELALPKGADTAMNPQFQTEGSVNPLYGEFKGAQTA